VITHPEKVLFPDDGITKGELAAYYEAIAPVLLPYLRGRPVTMERYPSGIGTKGFFQKNVAKGFPEWLERVEVPKKGGTVNHPLVSDVRSLLWVVNQNCITPHAWPSRVPDLRHPDLCVFDLDPAVEDAEALKAAALAVRNLLGELDLSSWVKTSGSKGYHIFVALEEGTSFRETARFAERVGRLLVERHPDLLTQEFAKVDRKGRILIDTGRNGYSATFAAVYAVRPRQAAPISAPVTWDEIESGTVGPATFTLRNMAMRVEAVGDLWSSLFDRPQSLKRAMELLLP
jgi:bifunctional non-homologous end joining protein LigD